MDHFICLIISPCPLNDYCWSGLILDFLIFYLLIILWSGWILSEFDVLLIRYDFLKVQAHRFSRSIVMFFSIVWCWAFASKFWRWIRSILLKWRNIGQNTCHLSVVYFFLLCRKSHSILHVKKRVKVVNWIELIFLFFGFRFTLWFWFSLLIILMNCPFFGATWFHNVNI